MADFDREDLAYTSQAGLYEEETAPVADERDISALRTIKKQADELKAIAGSTESLDLKHKTLSVEQQLFAYQFALEFLSPLTTTIQNAIDKVNKQGGGK